jgi:hypothetical protein
MRSSTMSQSNRAITDDPTDRSFLKRDQNDQRNDPDWGDHFPVMDVRIVIFHKICRFLKLVSIRLFDAQTSPATVASQPET